MDLPTTLLAARLVLEDFAERHHYNNNGKRPTGTVLSDEEIVFQMQFEYLEQAIQAVEDAKFARSLDEGAESNRPSLSVIGDWELADLQAALALVSGTASGPSSPTIGSKSSQGARSVPELLLPRFKDLKLWRSARQSHRLPFLLFTQHIDRMHQRV